MAAGNGRVTLAILSTKLDAIKDEQAKMSKKIDEDLVHKNDFRTVQIVVFGFVGIVLVTVILALIGRVVMIQ